jgi:hypothetical protein
LPFLQILFEDINEWVVADTETMNLLRRIKKDDAMGY